ncbi:MAG: DUF2442 domain-containing protein [Chloroflexi bacterium]|nr:DUF2442 domain-containing protein [Chloroflexota bacterium]
MRQIRVSHAEPLDAFVVLVTFENGIQKEINLEPFLHGPIFESIRSNPERFREIHIEGGTIAWSNGADIDPDVLYYELTPAWMEETEPV